MKNVSKLSLFFLIIFAVVFNLNNLKNIFSNNMEKISIDGSSTVFPISEAIGEEYQRENSDLKVIVNYSGTGGGFEKLFQREIDISNASREIKDIEKENAKENGIDYKEFKVAYDGITIAVSKDNTWVDYLTAEELKRMWSVNSDIKTWKDIRPNWPNEKINFYGPGSDSGTFEYFTQVVTGKDRAIRYDYTSSEDDNILVTGVSKDKNGIGFFGYAYYKENKDSLRAIPVDAGNGKIVPNDQTIQNGMYCPLSRPLYMYISTDNICKDYINDFLNFYFTTGTKYIKDVGYIPLNQHEYKSMLDEIDKIRKESSI